MSNLDDRADDYERRLHAAGGTEGILQGLVADSTRVRQVVKWLTISLIFDLFLSISLGFLSLVAWQNAEGIESNTDRFVDGQTADALATCQLNHEVVLKYNKYQEELARIERVLIELDPPEYRRLHKERITLYETGILPLPDCRKLK